MKQTIELMAAPTGMQPGGYIPQAFKDRTVANTKTATIEVFPSKKQWEVIVSWECPNPVSDMSGDTQIFVDAMALMVPVQADTPWVTMGNEDKPIEALMWQADKDKPIKVTAKGFGSTVRSAPPAGWRVKPKWKDGVWSVHINISEWPALSEQRQLSVAIWRGEDQERGGLKSVSMDWLSV